MNPIRLVGVGDVERHLLDAARRAIVEAYHVGCRDAKRTLDPAFAFHPERGQYHSTELVDALAKSGDPSEITVGVTAVDLFIPILTFVFGEAQLRGVAAVVSYHRLRQRFYGLPDDDGLTAERFGKGVIHEIGHVLGLTHCSDYSCVMAASHSVEYLDLKGPTICDECRANAGLPLLNSSTSLW